MGSRPWSRHPPHNSATVARRQHDVSPHCTLSALNWRGSLTCSQASIWPLSVCARVCMCWTESSGGGSHNGALTKGRLAICSQASIWRLLGRYDCARVCVRQRVVVCMEIVFHWANRWPAPPLSEVPKTFAKHLKYLPRGTHRRFTPDAAHLERHVPVPRSRCARYNGRNGTPRASANATSRGACRCSNKVTQVPSAPCLPVRPAMCT